ncbi:MAG: VOC family protein [Rubrobacteraceae bacterium]
MSVEVAGLDHIFITVEDLARSEEFYDRLMKVLGFRKSGGSMGGDPHIHYYNRQFGYSLRPARSDAAHDPYAPGLHHLCFRVSDEEAVDRAASELRAVGIETTEPRHYPEYAPDYYATFFEDPDGVRLEVMNFREMRRKHLFDWNHEPGATRNRIPD